MDVIRYGFLVATLGEDGAQALAKAAERAPTLAPVLVPRAILAWLEVVENFEGELPGVENTYVAFSKRENAYTGTITVGDTSYGFEDATAMHLAASLGIALGVDADQLDPSLKDVDLQRLGKSIDLLCKARKAVADIMEKKVLDPGAGYSLKDVHRTDEAGQQTTTVAALHPSAPMQHVGEATFSHNPDGKTLTPEMSFVHPEHRRMGLGSAIYAHAEKVTGKKVVPSPLQSENAQGLWAGNQAKPQFGTAKAEAPGGAAPPQKQGAPLAPMTPQKQPAMKPDVASAKAGQPGAATGKVPTPKAAPKAAKQPSVKLTMSQARKACPVCAMPQFQGERLTGCLCFGELAKSARAARTTEGFTVTFGPEWDGEAMQVFLEGLQGKAQP